MCMPSWRGWALKAKKKAVILVANFISISKDNSTLNMILICDMPLKLCYMLRMLTPCKWHVLCPYLHSFAHKMNKQSLSDRESKSKTSKNLSSHTTGRNYQGRKILNGEGKIPMPYFQWIFSSLERLLTRISSEVSCLLSCHAYTWEYKVKISFCDSLL